MKLVKNTVYSQVLGLDGQNMQEFKALDPGEKAKDSILFSYYMASCSSLGLDLVASSTMRGPLKKSSKENERQVSWGLQMRACPSQNWKSLTSC